MTNLFTAEDFLNIRVNWAAARRTEELANVFNRILNEKAVVHYGYQMGNERWSFSKDQYDKNDTHRALLIQIEEIKKAECPGHEPIGSDWQSYDGKWIGKCVNCGVKLRATWEPA